MGSIPHDASSIYRARLFRSVVPKTLPQGAEGCHPNRVMALCICAVHTQFSETIARLEGIVTSKGLTVLARIDHSGDAARVGLEMNPSEVLIFGSSKAGTPLMVASHTAAIDLPLKALAWSDADGNVWLSYNSPEYQDFPSRRSRRKARYRLEMLSR